MFRREKPTIDEIRMMTSSECRDSALRLLEREGRSLAPRQLDHAEKVLRSGREGDSAMFSRLALLSETDQYRRGWKSWVMGGENTPDEKRALGEYRELRALSEGTPSAGGYGVPFTLDPTVILSSQAADAPILDVCRIVTTTFDSWKGVSSPGVPLSYDTEAAVVADDSPTFSQPSIPVYKADGLLPYSYELEGDYPSFAEEMRRLLEQAQIDLLANDTLNGSGSGQPYGIKTRLEATAGQLMTSTTHGTIGAADVTTLFGSLKERFRKRSSWLMHGTVAATTRSIPAAGSGTPFAMDLAGRLLGKAVLESDYAGQLPTDTTNRCVAILGDFTEFVVVQRAGMNVEQVVQLRDPTTGRPTEQRAFYVWSRQGYDWATPSAFVGLANRTS
jgi:HK97 family phage major capsid protein